jgi:ferritin-like metal-binding protein YciE
VQGGLRPGDQRRVPAGIIGPEEAIEQMEAACYTG